MTVFDLDKMPSAYIDAYTTTTISKEMIQVVNALYTERVRIVDISFVQGVSSFDIKASDLGLSEHRANELNQALKSVGRIEVFKELTEASRSVRRIIDQLKRKHMIWCRPFWFVLETDIEAVVDAINKGRAEVDKIVEQISNVYEQGKQNYYNRLHTVLRLLPPELYESKFNQYAKRFPSLQEIKNNLRLEYYMLQIPSFTDIAKESLSAAEIVARKESLQIFETALLRSVEVAQQQVFETIRSAAQSISKLKHKSVPSDTERKLLQDVERLRTLWNYVSQVTDISLPQATELLEEAMSTIRTAIKTNQAELSAELEKLVEKLSVSDLMVNGKEPVFGVHDYIDLGLSA